MDVQQQTENPTFVAVANLAEFPEGTLKMVKVGSRRICLVHLSTGVHAIDNACPHEGYGLTQGELVGDQLTCVWHNWKFRVTDGTCTQGEEDVTSHEVRVADDGTISVAIRIEEPVDQIPILTTSLRSAIAHNYAGQISRDVIRLLKASANPGELVWEAVAFGAPRAEYGWGHAIASATDCLAIANDLTDTKTDTKTGTKTDTAAYPVIHAIASIADSERSRPIEPLPDPLRQLPANPAQAFRICIEQEQLADAQAILRSAIHSGHTKEQLTQWFTTIVSDHHLSYGHGAIYAQKAFELLEMVGWDRADSVLPYLVPTIVYGTREDKLPYMKPFMKQLAAQDLADLAAVPTNASWASWDGHDKLVEALLDKDRRRAFETTIAALRDGAGVSGILGASVIASSQRMLRYETAGEHDLLDDFNWLDITHGVTYAHAARWHHEQSTQQSTQHEPSPDTLRLALFSTFLTHWTGRHEWHTKVGPSTQPTPIDNDLYTYGRELQQSVMHLTTASPIHHMHEIKNSRAAALESIRLNTNVPLLAAQRFIEAPKLGFLSATIARSEAFLNGRAPRDG
jgi:nitrite reductase/ring-hydroxylating ferredoxin subunit